MNPQSDPPTIPFLTAHIPLPIKNGIRIGDWIDEIALKEVFHYSDNTILKYKKEGTLPHTQFGSRYFFNIADIIKEFEKNRR